MTAVADPPGLNLRIVPGPRNAHTDPKSGLRYYSWLGRDLPSVTSIRRMAGLPHGLHQWTVSQVIDYALDHWADLSKTLGKRDPAAVALVKHELRAAATAQRDAAANLGTAVHDAFAEGKALTEVPPEVAPRLRQAYDWQRVSGAEILAREFQVWELTHGYAGTVDALVRFPPTALQAANGEPGSIWVCDWKTGKGVYGEHALQLLAYTMAEFAGADGVVDDEVTALLREARGMAVLHLTDRHWEFRALEADSATWAAFRGLLAFAMWMRDHESGDAVTVGKRKGEA